VIELLSPMLAWGALLGAIPIIIHLLNRRRFRTVEWAPMRLLKLTIQKNRRRIQLEELLLLILRTALLVLLFLLLARPVLNPTGLERWLGAAGRSSELILVDDSLSMGYGATGPDAFSRAREVAGGLLAELRPRDRITLVAASRPDQPILLDVEASDREALSAGLSELRLTSTRSAWPAIFQSLEDVLNAASVPIRQVTMLTDLRRSGWEAELEPFAQAWRDRGLSLRILDIGEEATSNVALQALEPLDRTALAGVATRWRAEVRNASTGTLSGAKAILRVEGRVTEIELPELAPGETAELPIEARFSEPGTRDLSLELPGDELPGDNRRFAAVDVFDALRIRLVDGEPSTEPFGSEIDYLAAPLSIGVGVAEAWRVEVVTEEEMTNPRRGTPDLLILANVVAPTPEQAETIRRQVADGMGLMIFLGDQVDIDQYHQLFDREDGPLLPARLTRWREHPTRGLIVEPIRPSPIEALLDLSPAALERVAVREIMGVEEPSDADSVRVLARWNDPERSPAILERVVGAGRVLLWTTTADREGSDWPVEPSFVLAVREAVMNASRPSARDRTLAAGEPISKRIATSREITDARLEPPGAGEPRALTAVPLEAGPEFPDGPGYALEIEDSRQAGLYRLSWVEGALGPQTDLYAVNPAPAESVLERIETEKLRERLAPLDPEIIRIPPGSDESFAPKGRELWKEGLGLLAALLVVEPFFAAWVSRSR